MIELFYALMIFCLVGAVIAIETRNMLSAVIALGVVGFGVSLMFLFLAAPDIAITQVVVEVLSLIILIRAATYMDNTAIELRQNNFTSMIALVFVGIFLMLCFWAFQDMVPFGMATMRVSKHYIDLGLKETGAANIVSAVILNYRGYDTVGEAIVLFTSILGAFVILRKHGKKKNSEEVIK